MTITAELAIAIAIVGIVLYVSSVRTAKTKDACVPARPTEFGLPAATAGINSIHERRGYRGINVHMCRTFTTTVSN